MLAAHVALVGEFDEDGFRVVKPRERREHPASGPDSTPQSVSPVIEYDKDGWPIYKPRPTRDYGDFEDWVRDVA